MARTKRTGVTFVVVYFNWGGAQEDFGPTKVKSIWGGLHSLQGGATTKLSTVRPNDFVDVTLERPGRDETG